MTGPTSGAAVELRVRLEDLERDPYPIYAQLRSAAPLSWVDSLGMWYATRHEDIRAILLDRARFTTRFDGSPIFDTFGAQMLTTEDAEHDRYRAVFQPAFSASAIRQRFESGIHAAASSLIDGFAAGGEIELRSAFAARLPVQTMLRVFGLPLDGERDVRRWFDTFERSLANFTRDGAVRAEAHAAVAEFHGYLRGALAATREAATGDRPTEASLLGTLTGAAPAVRLSDEEIIRNLSIVFFGGISTVEALLLNVLWALFAHPHTLERLRAERALLPKVVEETLRWLGPVQSATRHVIADTEYQGIRLRAGEVVNCMLGAANRDPAIFPDPDRFDVDRANLHRHLAFATGPHACVGFQLAKAEARVAVGLLLDRLPGLSLVTGKSSPPEGYEFRQPRRLGVAWRVG